MLLFRYFFALSVNGFVLQFRAVLANVSFRLMVLKALNADGKCRKFRLYLASFGNALRSALNWWWVRFYLLCP